MIADSGLFERVGRDLRAIVRRQQEALAAVIADSCRIKARVVSEDERESGLRRILNFGHTAGHAIEAVTKYRRFRHGEAVAYGMLAVADLGVRRGVFAEAERSALADLVARLGPLPAVSDLSAQALVDAMRRDKKVREGRLHVVLPTGIGATRIVDDVTDARPTPGPGRRWCRPRTWLWFDRRKMSASPTWWCSRRPPRRFRRWSGRRR